MSFACLEFQLFCSPWGYRKEIENKRVEFVFYEGGLQCFFSSFCSERKYPSNFKDDGDEKCGKKRSREDETNKNKIYSGA
jgi:hypothetical protein